MPIELPDLDTRTFEDLKREALLRIPQYTPEWNGWTDFNESDPGVTMVELFAWLTEMMFHQMNQIPQRNYIKFLQLLNLELRPAQAATAHLTFLPQEGAAVQPVPQGAQIGATTENGELLIFETDSGLDVIRHRLTSVQVFDGSAFQVVTNENDSSDASIRPFGWSPLANSALYLGFTQSEAPVSGRVFPQQMRFRVFMTRTSQAGVPQSCFEAENPPSPPVTLQWEYKPHNHSHRWLRLNTYEDETVAFTREGYILVEGPTEIEPTRNIGRVSDPHLWIRCRLDKKTYPAGTVPAIDFIRPNVVSARNISTVRNEIIGDSEGHPSQTFDLSQSPTVDGSLKLVTQVSGHGEVQWEQVDDFLKSGRECKHYTLNPNIGRITFGDGRRGLIPPAGAEIIAREYRFGGGDAGNLDANLINAPLTTLVGVESVNNERPSVGGRDEQRIEDLMEQAPGMLRSQNRAITLDDYQTLAEQVGGVKKATAIAQMHPDYPGAEVPGAVTVVIVPDTRDRPPKPSPDQIRQVCHFLNRRRVLTSEVYVKGPDYKKIKVEALVRADPYASLDKVSQEVQKALEGYLNPFKWQFGAELSIASLYSEIFNVEHVKEVERLTIFVNEVEQNIEVGNRRIPRIRIPDDGLVFSDGHEIKVIPNVNE